MRTHRLSRLALLSQGVALVGLGISQMACGKDSAAPETLHINAPPQTTSPPTINAPPDQATPSASAPVVASAPPSVVDAGPPRSPIRTNSPPFRLPQPPPAPAPAPAPKP